MIILSQKDISFPHPEMASKNGIVAIGGDLNADRLLLGYQFGFFPWYNPEEPIIWWHPDPRFVIFTEDIRVTKSMRPYFNQEKFKLSFDQDFEGVLLGCQKVKRPNQPGTWITKDIIEAYSELHELGYAHSVEVTNEKNELVGGLYGVSLGKIFFGESMFALENNASKFALISLAILLRNQGFHIIDCQMPNPHLKSMGGRFISRKVWMTYLRQNVFEDSIVGNWNPILNNIPPAQLLQKE